MLALTGRKNKMGKIRIPSLYYLYFGLILLGMSGFIFTVFLPSPMGFYAFIATAALGGFGVATNIFFTKKSKRQLVCPTGSDCNVVVNSRYSKFFGVSLERMGMAYFAFIVLAYLALIFVPHIYSPNAITILVALTLCAGLFSSYLLFVQAFLLRAWCIWCILASFLSITVFVSSFASLPVAIAFLAEFQNIISAIRFFGFAFAVGGATAAVFLFFRLLKDLDIDDKELHLLNGILELVWVGFGLILIGQLAFYVIYADSLANSSLFIIQTAALFIAAFGNALSMIIYGPFLVFVPFKENGVDSAVFSSLRLPTAIVWAITLASWYFALSLDFIQKQPGLQTVLISYGIVLVLAIIGGIIWEKRFVEKKKTAEPELAS